MSRSTHERIITATGAAPEASPTDAASEAPSQLGPAADREPDSVARMNAEELTAAVDGACAAVPGWAAMSAADRAAVLHAAAERLRARAEELIHGTTATSARTADQPPE
jgi:acyl-CoA reductase-like NAD-dependent aldehyde dehydrogenase